MPERVDPAALRGALRLLESHPAERAAVVVLVRLHDRWLGLLLSLDVAVNEALLKIEELETFRRERKRASGRKVKRV